MRSDSRVRNEVEFIDANSSEHRYLELAARIQTLLCLSLSLSSTLVVVVPRRLAPTSRFRNGPLTKLRRFQTSQIPPSHHLRNKFIRFADFFNTASSLFLTLFAPSLNVCSLRRHLNRLRDGFRFSPNSGPPSFSFSSFLSLDDRHQTNEHLI